MGGGILPIAFYKGKIYFLFGRVYIQDLKKEKDGTSSVMLHKAAGLWSDFGGARDNNETYKETASREGYEELSGILGSKKKIKYLVNNYLYKITSNGYRSYIVIIDYDKTLPKKFRDKFLSIKKNKPHLVCKNGLYEKDMIKWFSYDDIKNNSSIFRIWYYKEIIKEVFNLF